MQGKGNFAKGVAELIGLEDSLINFIDRPAVKTNESIGANNKLAERLRCAGETNPAELYAQKRFGLYSTVCSFHKAFSNKSMKA